MRRFTLAASLAILSACFAGPAAAQKSADTLRWASTASITAVDPYFNAHREAMIVNGQLVWDTLAYRDPGTGEYKPLLAKSWRWLNDVTIEFTLRDDVKFHDGIGLTADDAVYTLNYVSDPKNKVNVQSNVNWIKNAEKTGTHTFKLNLKAPFPPAFEYISSLLAILPKDFFGAGGVAGGNGRLVGTGPYRLTSFVPGSTIDVERFDGYFSGSPKGKPAIKKIRYRVIPDNSTQMGDLMSGGLDWMWYVPPDQAKRLSEVKKVNVQAAETMRISFLSFNTREMATPNPMLKPKVREAIAHAIDRDKITKFVVGAGSSTPKSGCYKTQFGCRQDVKQFNYDPALAKKLLAEAGYPNGLTIELTAFRSREWTEAVANYLNAVGIKTNITFLQYAAAFEKVTNNSAHLYLGDWGSYSINDVSAILNNFFTLSPNDMAQDKELAGWLRAASATVDQKTRKVNYDKAVAKIASEIYWLPLWVHPVVYATDTNLDFRPFSDENPRLFLTRWK
ncbi:ABC transporter substrate-binding protein [Lacisediminimonas profundi]|uniref:ABC transporter substrate-binding protein n=1 Tax=Lacisediminimonas profundi TaxID=2603856 RepID=UPI0013868D9C|nr:ABC transporter substrate-binding protein [Lacisediminimonas profundi]